MKLLLLYNSSTALSLYRSKCRGGRFTQPVPCTALFQMMEEQEKRVGSSSFLHHDVIPHQGDMRLSCRYRHNRQKRVLQVCAVRISLCVYDGYHLSPVSCSWVWYPRLEASSVICLRSPLLQCHRISKLQVQKLRSGGLKSRAVLMVKGITGVQSWEPFCPDVLHNPHRSAWPLLRKTTVSVPRCHHRHHRLGRHHYLCHYYILYHLFFNHICSGSQQRYSTVTNLLHRWRQRLQYHVHTCSTAQCGIEQYTTSDTALYNQRARPLRNAKAGRKIQRERIAMF